MTIIKLINKAIETTSDDYNILVMYRRNLRQVSDLITTDKVMRGWYKATANIDNRLKNLGVPQ